MPIEAFIVFFAGAARAAGANLAARALGALRAYTALAFPIHAKGILWTLSAVDTAAAMALIAKLAAGAFLVSGTITAPGGTRLTHSIDA